MKITNKKITTLILGVISILCVLTSVCFMSNSTVKAQLSSVNIESQYVLGDTVEIPQADITLGNQTLPAQVKVVFPSGTTYQKSSIVLSEAGKYSIIYSAKFAGKTIVEEKSFLVLENSYETSAIMDSVRYDDEKQAVITTITSGTFNYNKVIDLSDNTKEDSIIDLFVLSEQTGKPDFHTLFIKLTDANDPTNFIIVSIRNTQMQYPHFLNNNATYEYLKYQSYVVGMIGQDQWGAGLESTGKIYKNDIFGTSTRFSFMNYGYYGDSSVFSTEKCIAPEDASLSVRLDYDTKQLWIKTMADNAYGKPKMVCDFDDMNYFAETWNGFSSGKCLMSIYATGFITSSATIGIKAIEGESLIDKSFEDNVAPVIDVDFGDYSEDNIPQGVVGKEYRIFDYSVVEDYGVKSSTVNVYYNFYSDNKISVSIKDGKFKMDKAGTYVIKYEVVDNAGNVSAKFVAVNADEEISELSVSVPNFSETYAGTSVILPEINFNSNEIYGKVHTKIVATCGNLEVEVNDNTFIPMQVGDWTISYYVENDGGQKAVCEKTLKVKNYGSALFLDSIADLLPKYFISGNTYKLPNLDAYEFDSQSYQKVKSQVKYAYKGAFIVAENNLITPEVDYNGDKIKIKYFVGASETEVIEIPVQKVKIANKIDMTKLFAIKNGEVNVNADKASITYTSSSEYDLEFINGVIAEGFSFKFKFNDYNTSRVILRLYDKNDQNVCIKAEIICREDGIYCLVGGFEKKVLETISSTIMVDYSNGQIEVNGHSFIVKKCENGKEFNGFSSGITYFGFSGKELNSESSISFSLIANQPLSNYEEDSINPTLMLNKDVNKYSDLNSYATIPSAIATDVIDGEVDVYVSVKCNGKTITACDGTILDGTAKANVEYKILLATYGTYSVRYVTKDNSRVETGVNERILPKSIIVLDVESPIIKLKGSVVATAKVGNAYQFNEVNISDNISKKFTVGVVIISENDVYEYVVTKTNDMPKKYTFTAKGKYIVRYFAIDEVGNLGYLDTVVTVG